MKTLYKITLLTFSLLLVKADDELPNHYTTNPSIVPVKSCCDLRIYPPPRVPSGVYKMSMGTFGTANVYCDMTTADGGWIVIQRKVEDSSISFFRNWREYEDGFGNINNDFWYGLRLMHFLTQSGQWEMRVDFRKQDGSLSYVHYNQFKVGSASEKYKLMIGGYVGGDGNYFTSGDQPTNNRMFTTLDNDNDLWSSNCAIHSSYRSGWWFNRCVDINPNAVKPFYNWPQTAESIEMKIRSKNCA